MLIPLLLHLAAPVLAQDVLVPDFTPESAREEILGAMLSELLVAELEDRGYVVIDGEALRNRAGRVVERCAETSACPAAAFEAWRGDVMVVGAVAMRPRGLEMSVRIHVRGRTVPVDSFRYLVPEGDEPRAVSAAADRVERVVRARRKAAASGGGRSAGDDRERRRRAEEEERRRRAEEEERRRRAEEERRRRAEEERRRAERSRYEDLDEEPPLPPAVRKGPWLPRRLRAEAERSRLGVARWMEEHRVRERGWTLELRGGAVLGDTDRAYDVRVALDATTLNEIDRYQLDTLVAGTGLLGELQLGFQVHPALEAGLVVGVHTGDKLLSVGWESYDGEALDDGDVVLYDPVGAMVGVLEPRLRAYPLVKGLFKPYLLAGFGMRFMDGYEVPDLQAVDYPDRGGRVTAGITAGAGLALDLRSTFSLGLEVPFTWEFLGAEPVLETSWRIQEEPPVREQAGFLLRPVLTGQLRF